ncbi:MAG: hypothetical protein HYX92_07750 [Chloroflexi bacterium]|nr:hypothetical protein [Chloroflexota bacterium]
MALLLMHKGIKDARPLEGGFNALVAIGYPMELKEPVVRPKQKIILGARPI